MRARFVLLLLLLTLAAGCRTIAAAPPGVVFVYGAQQVWQVDGGTLTVRSRISLPGPVIAGKVDGRRRQLDLLCAGAANSLLSLSLANPTVRRTIPLGVTPVELVFSHNLNYAYVAGNAGGTAGWLVTVNLERGRVVRRHQLAGTVKGLDISADGSQLVAAESGGAEILSSARPGAHSRLVTLAPAPRQIVMPPFGDKAFLLCGDRVAVVDARHGVLLTYLPVGPNAQRMLLKPDGGELYVSNASGTVSVVDTATNEISGTMPAGLGAGPMAVAADGSALYVANRAAGTISALSLSDRSVLALLQVGQQPADLALGAAGGYIFAADQGSDDVAVARSNQNPSNPNSLLTLLPSPPQPRLLWATPRP